MALKDIDLKNMSLGDLLGLSLPKIKVSSRVVSIIVIILSALVFYWMYSTKLPEIKNETEKIKSENIPLAATEQNLNKMYANMVFYQNETTRCNNEYENAISQFPPYMYLEDKVHFVNQLRNGDFSGYGALDELTYGESSFVSSGAGEGGDSSGAGEGGEVVSEEGGSQLELYAVPISGKFVNISYSNLKRFMTYGLTSNRRFVLEDITIHQNEDTAELTCDFTFKTFFLSGQDRPYEYSGSSRNSGNVDNSFLQDPVKNPFGLP